MSVPVTGGMPKQLFTSPSVSVGSLGVGKGVIGWEDGSSFNLWAIVYP